VRKGTTLILAAFASVALSCGGGNQHPQTEQQAEDRIGELLKDCERNIEEEQYQKGLAAVDEILGLCRQFSIRQNRIYDITDKKHFLLQRLGRFDEALKVAFELEDMPEEAGNRKSPWNYLKIADSYFGMHDFENAVHWMEKAVYERGFIRYQALEHER
jgi:tetratricopeptide (TPR) repeat protein